ncbi:hypothetical protein BD413DRAFT_438189, partial [Trametes elegans]
PRKLARPDLPDIKPEIVVSAQPGYEGISPSHVRSSWSHMGYKYVRMYRKIFLDPPKSALPAAYNILLRDGGIAMCCTHLFAVYAYAAPGTFGPAARRRKCPRYRRVVGLYPTHAAIWAAYCARLPALPLRPTRLKIFEDPRAGAGAERATVLHLPVVPLAVPCPRMFLPVVMFVYSFRQSTFVSVLLPCAAFELPADSVATPLAEHVPQYAQALADEGDMARLCRIAKNVHDVWRNMVALGVVEDRMWEALDIAWEIVLTAMELVD